MVRSNFVLILLFYSILLVMGNGAANAQTPSRQSVTLENNEYDYQVFELEEYDSLVYNQLFFQQLAAIYSEATPYNIGYGMEISSVYMFGNSINFSITCDFLTCLCLDWVGEDNADTVKYELALALYGFFDDMGCDDNGDGIVAKMKSIGLELNYNFYVDELQDTIMSFTITGDYITRAVENSNGIYTI